MKLRIRDGQWLMLGFFVGILLGTVFANTVGADFQEQIGILGNYVGERLPAQGGYRGQLFLMVLRQRGLELLLLWLLSLTALAMPACVAAAGYYGFSMAVILSMTTMQMGITGLPGFLSSLLPQYLVYVPFWCLFALRCMRIRGRFRYPRELGMHVASFLLFLVIFAAGAWLEAYVGPEVLRKILIKF